MNIIIMKFVKYVVAAVVAVVAFMGVEASAQSLSKSTTWHWDRGTIVVDCPERPDGQEHVVGLAVEPIETLRVGFVRLLHCVTMSVSVLWHASVSSTRRA